VVGGGAPKAGFLVRNIRLESAGAAPAVPAAPVAAAAAQLQKLKLNVTTSSEDWNHVAGQPLKFRISFSAEAPVTDSISVRYRLGPEKFEGAAKTVLVPPGGVEIDAGVPSRAGFVRLIATAQVGEKELKGTATAAVSADQIRPTQTEPADFDAFWAATRAELKKIPMDPVLTPKPELSGPNFDAYELSLANYDPLGEKPRFYGVLCVPKGAGPFPAILQTPGAGVRGYKGEIWVPRDQFITLEVGIHGIPVTEPGKFYNEQASGPLKDYQTRNLADRDTFYYRRVYAGVMRSLEYLASHPKWDGKNLVTRGGSQGGQLAIVGAALDSRVTAVAAAFPAWCDVTGYLEGRAGGWPGLFTGQAPTDEAAKARRAAQVATTGYYDTVNFARRLKVPAYFAWGYNDDVCPPTSFYAMLSVVTAPKEVKVWKDAFHNLPGEGWGAYTNWTVTKARGK
jgi:cephalosporin-C deacetylase-like acetyl esterase